MLDDYLERLPAEAWPGVTEKAVAAAREPRDACAELLLLSIFAPDAAARLVCRRLEELGGDVDIVLRPASERLAASHPLAAVPLHRWMPDAPLARARTQNYDRVVQDLLAAGQVAVLGRGLAGRPGTRQLPRGGRAAASGQDDVLGQDERSRAGLATVMRQAILVEGDGTMSAVAAEQIGGVPMSRRHP